MSTTTNPKHKCLLVTHDAINFSPSKAKYSFSRDQRFKSISGTKREASEFNVNLPNTFGRRSPSFGIGDRFKSINKNGKFLVSFTHSRGSIRHPHLSLHFLGCDLGLK